ncbi:MAG: hypothetical protein ABEK01_03615 [Candidatus Nanohaloarchaea archaeon]
MSADRREVEKVARKGGTWGMPVMVVLGVIILLIGGIQIPKQFLNMFAETSNSQWDEGQLNELGKTASKKCAAVTGGTVGGAAEPANLTIDIRSSGYITLRKSEQYRYRLVYEPANGKAVIYKLSGCKYNLKFPESNYRKITSGDWRIGIEAENADKKHPTIDIDVRVD